MRYQLVFLYSRISPCMVSQNKVQDFTLGGYDNIEKKSKVGRKGKVFSSKKEKKKVLSLTRDICLNVNGGVHVHSNISESHIVSRQLYFFSLFMLNHNKRVKLDHFNYFTVKARHLFTKKIPVCLSIFDQHGSGSFQLSGLQKNCSLNFSDLSPVVIIALTEVFDGTVPSKILFPFS